MAATLQDLDAQINNINQMAGAAGNEVQAAIVKLQNEQPGAIDYTPQIQALATVAASIQSVRDLAHTITG